jgi:putative hemolysin
MSTLELLLCAILVLTSAFVSASEVALFSLSRFQLRAIRERVKTPYRAIRKLLKDPGGLLMTILVTNELVNISLSTVIADVISRGWSDPRRLQTAKAIHTRWFSSSPDWIIQAVLGVLVTTPIVLLLCDMTPKAVAARTNQFLAPLLVGPLQFLYAVMKPPRLLLKRTVRWTARVFAGDERQLPDPETPPANLREEEFIHLLEEGQKEGAIAEGELELIRRVFDLDDTPIIEVATPLQQVHSLPAQTTIQRALQQLSPSGKYFSRIPITGPGKSGIIGVLYSKDLLLTRLDPSRLESPIAELSRKPMRISASTRLSAAFRRLKQTKMHLAVVEDSEGRAVAIVTMSDILDALFEDVLVKEDIA